MGFDIQKAILRTLVEAQIASDSAKGIGSEIPEYVLFQGFDRIWTLNKRAAYAVKDKAIIRALSFIDANRRCGINYYVTRNPDQNGAASNVIYFTFRLNGRRYQISFHNFTRSVRYGWAEPKKGSKCHWEGGIGGSRKTAIAIIQTFFAGAKSVKSPAIGLNLPTDDGPSAGHRQGGFRGERPTR